MDFYEYAIESVDSECDESLNQYIILYKSWKCCQYHKLCQIMDFLSSWNPQTIDLLTLYCTNWSRGVDQITRNL